MYLQKKETILIVDDSKFQRAIIKEMLGEHFHLEEATSGEECLMILEKSSHLIDLVLLDLVMPGIDGFEAKFCDADRRWMHLKISIFADVSDTTDSGKFIWDTIKDANPNHVCPVIAICREGSLDQIQTAVSSEIIDDLLFSPLEVSVLKRRIKASIHPDKNNEADA